MSTSFTREVAGRDELSLRSALESDCGEIVDLLAATMGWAGDDRDRSYFHWKHFDNAFGTSPSWVVVDHRGERPRLAGFRTMLRWDFHDGTGVVRAVRAVDTATHPDYQGQGLFKRLTLHALDDLADDGIDLVFNTPNDQSRPGYLKMGWQELGSLPLSVQVSSPMAAARMSRSVQPASKWSEPTNIGYSVCEVCAAGDALEELLVQLAPAGRLHTDHSPRTIAWRYGFEPLHYRAALATQHLADGILIFRLRRRGASTEVVVCEELFEDPRVAASVRRDVMRQSGADYAVRAGRRTKSTIPLPGRGPIVTARKVAIDDVPALDRFRFTLGDIELL